MITISTHNGDKVSIQHNLRNPRVCSKQSHIDPNGHHEDWVYEDIRVAYGKLFGEAVRSYNANQSRKDRRISDYYKHIKSLNKNQHKPVYEMIIGVYNSHYAEDGKRYKDEIDDKTKHLYKTILKEFVDGWTAANPSLYLIGAHEHEDEEGFVHVHLDYIPVGRFNKGLSKRVSMKQALSDMGYIAQKQANRNEMSNPIAVWNASENKRLESICNKYGLKIDHPDVNVDRKTLSVDDYKRLKEKERQELLLKRALHQNEIINKNKSIIQKQVDTYNKNKAIFPKQIEAINKNNQILDKQALYIDSYKQQIIKTKEELKSLNENVNLSNSRLINRLKKLYPSVYLNLINEVKGLNIPPRIKFKGK